MRSSANRNILDEIDSNADKNDNTSTCLNYKMKEEEVNELETFAENELNSRNRNALID